MDHTSPLEKIIRGVLITLVLVFFLFPILWIFLMSLQTNETILTIPPSLSFTPIIDNYTALITGNLRTAAGSLQLNFMQNMFNSVLLSTCSVALSLVLGVPAAYAFARYRFRGRDLVFGLVLLQLMITPDILAVVNYRTMRLIGAVDTIWGIALPYLTSAFGIFLLRQTFLTVPKELDEAARIEGCGSLGVLWRVYVPAARPIYLAYGLVQVSYHWNNFLWPLIITNSVETRPLTVGLSVFSSVDQGIDWSVITAATLITSGPLLIAFLIFQRQFVQSFMRAGIR